MKKADNFIRTFPLPRLLTLGDPSRKGRGDYEKIRTFYETSPALAGSAATKNCLNTITGFTGL
ncbi:MAG: hypothetical protein HQK76_19210 [Desulfobacterales bacterium]|nr:hypothetical protein [Desulfobacterales bacterium]